MVYVYAKKSNLDKYIGKELTVEQIEETLIDLGMDIKGVSDDLDPELKVEITAEKTDMVSVVGIARAIKYYRGLSKGVPKYDIAKAKNKVIVKETAEKCRPKTACVILKNMKITEESLEEMIEIQEKIHDSFGRNRKKVAIGIYPCDEFEFPVTFGGEKPQDIKFRPLESTKEMNGKEIITEHETGKKFAHLLENLDYYPVFRDKNGDVLSMPPVINSHKTGRVETKHSDLFVEVSGHNLTYLDNILKVITTTFIEMGAIAESVTVEYHNGEVYELDLSTVEDKISLDYVNKLIGINVDEDKLPSLLNKVMYGFKNIEDDTVTIEIPCFKSDVWYDCDIADDIARAYGYNNIIPKFPSISTIGETLSFSQFRERVSNTLANQGFLELYTYILSSKKSQFNNMLISEEDFKFVKLVDSADQGINMCRISILPEILTSLNINRKNKYPQKVFENGFTIQVNEKSDTKADNVAHLAVAIADPKADYTMIKETLDTTLNLNEISFEIEVVDLPYYIKGRSANVIVNGKVVGSIGEIHPQVLENFGILVPVSAFEISLNKLN